MICVGVSSYAWPLMVLNYLQVKGFIPNLQSSEFTFPKQTIRLTWGRDNGKRVFDVSFFEDRTHAVFEAKPFDSGVMFSLLYEFMVFWGYEYRWDGRQTTCIRSGGMTDVPREIGFKQDTRLIVRDPFELDRNCTGLVRRWDIIKEEFQRAVWLFCDNKFEDVFVEGMPLHERNKQKRDKVRRSRKNKKTAERRAAKKEAEAPKQQSIQPVG